jgi:hypothetical protein
MPVACAYFHLRHEPPGPVERAGTHLSSEVWQPLFDSLVAPVSPMLAAPARPVYPYSVIPGGVSNVEELRQRLKDDPLIAEHLKNFDLSKAALVRTTAPRAVYVSYRVGDLIFWTRTKLTVARGELLVTDGKRTIRGRCGNDISDVPRLPRSPSLEPSPREFDHPLLAARPPLEPSDFEPGLIGLGFPPNSPPFGGPVLTPGTSHPPVSVPPYLGVGPEGSATPAPSPTPELPTSLLLSLGGAAAGLGAVRTRFQARNRRPLADPVRPSAEGSRTCASPVSAADRF